MEIRVKEIRVIDKKGLKGVAVVEVGPLTIWNFRIMDYGRGLLVGWPEEPWTTKDGQRKYSPVVRAMTDEFRRAVEQAILQAWNEQAAGARA